MKKANIIAVSVHVFRKCKYWKQNYKIWFSKDSDASDHLGGYPVTISGGGHMQYSQR